MMVFRVEHLVPRFLRNDKNGRAMAKALEAALKYALEAFQRGVDLLTDVDTMPEWRLDELAWELNTPWYVHSAGVSAKRSAILSGESVNRRLGTPWAVATVAKMYFGSSSVIEWQEYDGEPFHFQVTTSNLSAVTNNSAIFRELILRTKNARSVFDGVIVNPSAPNPVLYAGYAMQTVRKMTLPVGFK